MSGWEDYSVGLDHIFRPSSQAGVEMWRHGQTSGWVRGIGYPDGDWEDWETHQERVEFKNLLNRIGFENLVIAERDRRKNDR